MSSSGVIAKCSQLWTDINWFALHTKPHREDFAAKNVSALGLESFLPRLKVERLVRGATRTVIKPLFLGYFFARFRPEDSIESVKSSRGVLRVISSGRFPIPVEDKIIREILDRIEEDGLIRMKLPALKPGVRVSVQTGPFEGLMGRVERELDDGRRVEIFLETLLHARVQIHREWLEVAAA